MNRAVLNELTDMDYAKTAETLGAFIRNRVKSAKKGGVVLGLSGGIDSAVAAALARDAFPEGSLAMIMPDSKVSPDEETRDALRLVDSMGMDYKLLDISLIVNEYAKVLEPSQMGAGNLRARVRTNVLYYYANIRDRLVLGSSDRSEYLIGYFTKFGDGAADIMPMASLYKTQIRGLAGHLGIPQDIIDKKSSPNLWPGHDAEAEIGAPYEEIDPILHCVIDRNQSVDDCQKALDIPRERIERIIRMYQDSRHKREMAATAAGTGTK